jgi:hypothetical protein
MWGWGPSYIYWTLDPGRFDLQCQGKLDEIRARSLVIKTDEGLFHNIGVTCENVDKFLTEIARMGTKVIREPGLHSHSD